MAATFFLLLFVLTFYGPVNQMGSCRVWSVYLTTCLLDKRLTSIVHILSPETDLLFLNQQKGENDCRKYFTINLHERMIPTSAGVKPATSCSPVGRRIQLSHRGQHILLVPNFSFLLSSRTQFQSLTGTANNTTNTF